MPISRTFTRAAALCAGLALLAGCAPGAADLNDPPEPLGDFRLGYAIVVDKNAKMVPPSREAEPGEWEAALKKALEDRFARYEGDQLYHIAVNVDGYALAVPGVPVVLSPKSILIVSANVWDDAAGKKLHEEAEQLSVFEEFSGDTVVGSGLTRTREEQIQSLAENMAKRIERWLVSNREEWFAYDPATQPAPEPAPATEPAPEEAPEPAEAAGDQPSPAAPTDA
ncbi:hypothetical protein [Rhodovulum adriaticum]|uniref:Lipoprotein n=1 Tax=Rhodovulum adriaticum TaxID=35804 RepID=A0A4R2NK39_RHOAD|nr:hypothetical protein [Rhodovulum adriaticum]MBK1637092.1 hypothetical protein [Rhodovulum adriaticum]TCP21857.1 hypothetical protein EV656_109109 [Rhodovulum adriaticum]